MDQDQKVISRAEKVIMSKTGYIGGGRQTVSISQ